VTNLLSTVGFFAVLALLGWLGWGLEPHWASKDGRKVMCRMQLSPDDPLDRPRWHDVKIAIDDRELYVFARSRRAADLRGNWRVVGAVNDDTKRRRIYELRSQNDDAASVRVPLKSRCVPVLDELVP
jgi:hypothetical protein